MSFKLKNVLQESIIEEVKFKVADGEIFYPIPSDVNIKENIKVVQDLQSSRELINKLQVKTFNYKQRENNSF